MHKASSLPDRYRIGKTQFYERRNYLIQLGYDMEPCKQGRNSFYSDEQISKFDALHAHFRQYDTFEGFPPAISQGSESHLAADTNSVSDRDETELIHQPGQPSANESVETEEILIDTNPLEDIQESNFRRLDEAAQFAAAQNLVALNYLTVSYMRERRFTVPGLAEQVEKSGRVVEESIDSLKQSPEAVAKKLMKRITKKA
jgi:hypothetical protein